MSRGWACTVQHYLLKAFPRAATNIRLPLWVWRRLCSGDCTVECSTTCRGCRRLAEERKRKAAASLEQPAAEQPAVEQVALEQAIPTRESIPQVVLASADVVPEPRAAPRRRGCGCGDSCS